MKIPKTMEEQALLVALASYMHGRNSDSQKLLPRAADILVEYGMAEPNGLGHVTKDFLIEKYANQCVASGLFPPPAY